VEDDVARLQIPVQHAALVGMMDCPGDFRHQFRDLPGVLTGPVDTLSQVSPFQQLHREIRLIVLHPDVVDRHDVGVVQLGRVLRLNLESADGLGRGEVPREHHLQRHHAPRADLPGLVYDPHPPARQLL
jgi:hypothetical protein